MVKSANGPYCVGLSRAPRRDIGDGRSGLGLGPEQPRESVAADLQHLDVGGRVPISSLKTKNASHRNHQF